MALFIDYLLDAENYIKQKSDQIKKFELQYRNVYDKDIKREIALLKTEIKHKNSEIIEQILINLEEMKSIKKYFPELFAVFCEDEYVGSLIKKKEWLLDLVSLPPETAIQKITAIKNFRKFLKTAKKIINQGNNKIDVKTLLMRFPLLSGKISEGMYKEDAITQIQKFDAELKKEGWSIVLSNQLIQLPLNKFLSKLQISNSFYVKAKELVEKSNGKGSVAEASALKNLRKISQKKIHFENIIKQILLANPAYLRNLKSSKSWLSKTQSNPLDLLVKNLTPKSIKEQLWLREMRERLKE